MNVNDLISIVTSFMKCGMPLDTEVLVSIDGFHHAVNPVYRGANDSHGPQLFIAEITGYWNPTNGQIRGIPEGVACPHCGGYVRGHQWIAADRCSINHVSPDRPMPAPQLTTIPSRHLGFVFHIPKTSATLDVMENNTSPKNSVAAAATLEDLIPALKELIVLLRDKPALIKQNHMLLHYAHQELGRIKATLES